MMCGKPTYEELEQRIKELEGEIDKRKQVKEALRDSEARLKALSEASFEAIFLSEKGVCLDQNQTAERMFGYTHAEAVGRNGTEWIIREDMERVKNNMLSGYEKPYEVTALRKDGTTFSCEIQCRMIDCQGRSIRTTALRDITEHKKAEEALRESKEQIRQLLECAGDAVFVQNQDGRFVQVNKQAFKNLGYSRNELLALHTWDVEVGWTRNDLNEIFQNIRTSHPETHEGTHRRKNGSTFPVEVRVSIFRWKSHNFMLAFARDITKRKQSEAVLRQREQYLRGLNEAAQALLVPADTVPFQEFVDKIGPASDAGRTYVFINHHDPDGSLLMSQKAEWCAEGISPKIDNPQLQGLSYDVWFPRWKDTLEHGDIISGLVSGFPAGEREILDPQGIMAILIIPIMVDGEFVGFIGFDNCVSECEWEWDAVAQTFLRAAANDLAQAIKRAQSEELVRASLKEKEVLLREIHHRVKNNMQVIVSLLRMHSRSIDDARLGQIFDDCRCRVNAMSLIHEALYLSKDLARIDFEVYLKKLCRNLSQAYGASRKGIAVTVEQCNAALDMDQGIAVGMVISELVSNAFKHAFPLGKGGRVLVSLSCIEGKEIELIVQDDGKGLPPEIGILNPPSLGLRLATAAVTRELDGSIEVERDGGTRFIIHFKCKSN